MQCPDCGYISFKQEKVCGSCGFNLKKAAISNSSLFRNDSFTIFSSPKASEEEQRSVSATKSQAEEGIAVIDPPEDSQENPELESGEFLLNLSEAKLEEPEADIKSEVSEPSTSDFAPMEFGTDSEISLEEMEVEGLGLGLEPLEEELPPTPETSKTESEEIQPETDEKPGAEDVETPDSSENIELKINEPDNISLDEEEASDSVDIVLNLNELEELDEEPEIVTSSSQETVEPASPVLDLGDTEIVLDLDEEPEPESPDPSPPVPALNDELEIKLEIDDSDGPLTISDDVIPEVEIEDLGLELEESDDPPPNPEKP